jgi:hypothetical protein
MKIIKEGIRPEGVKGPRTVRCSFCGSDIEYDPQTEASMFNHEGGYWCLNCPVCKSNIEDFYDPGMEIEKEAGQ